jgi:hypothetical protein
MSVKVFTSFVEELEARVKIEDTLKRGMRGIDRQDWKLACTLYHEGGYDDHGFFKGPGDELMSVLAKLHEHQDHSMHVISNIIIEFKARDRAFVESYILSVQRFLPSEPTVPASNFGLRKIVSARCLDLFEERHGEWRVVHRTVVFGDILSVPMPEPHRCPPGFVEQKHSNEDPLYLLRSE